MKRRLLKLGLFLLLGTIVNVAVAWGCTWRPHLSWSNETLAAWFISQPDDRLWSVHLFEAPGAAEMLADNTLPEQFEELFREHLLQGEELEGSALVTTLPAWTSFSRTDVESLYTVRRESAYGWPCLSMTQRLEHFHQESGGIVPTHGLAPQRDVGTLRVGSAELPVSIYWPGFPINTLFYAAILWLLFAAPSFVRRRMRLRPPSPSTACSAAPTTSPASGLDTPSPPTAACETRPQSTPSNAFRSPNTPSSLSAPSCSSIPATLPTPTPSESSPSGCVSRCSTNNEQRTTNNQRRTTDHKRKTPLAKVAFLQRPVGDLNSCYRRERPVS